MRITALWSQHKQLLSPLAALFLLISFLSYFTPLHAIEEQASKSDAPVVDTLIEPQPATITASTTPGVSQNSSRELEDFLRSRNISRITYSFRSPEGWNVSQAPVMGYTRVENFKSENVTDRNEGDYFKIEVVALPSDGLGLNEWVERQVTTSYPLPVVQERGEMEIAGQRAIHQVEVFGSNTARVFYVAKGGTIYIIAASRAEDKYKVVVDEFIANLNFN